MSKIQSQQGNPPLFAVAKVWFSANCPQNHVRTIIQTITHKFLKFVGLRATKSRLRYHLLPIEKMTILREELDRLIPSIYNNRSAEKFLPSAAWRMIRPTEKKQGNKKDRANRVEAHAKSQRYPIQILLSQRNDASVPDSHPKAALAYVFSGSARNG